jgi:poly [ADP-ribose] polymerase
MRWGRVGYKGQNSWTECQTDLDKAKDVFTKKFYDKTRNEWALRDSFEKVGTKDRPVQLWNIFRFLTFWPRLKTLTLGIEVG